MSDATFSYDSLKAIERDADRFTLLEKIQSTGTPLEIADRYHSLHTDAYWNHKDLPLVITLAAAGIQFCLTHAAIAPADIALKLRANAKALAYNLASFTWPGWNEPGISPTPDQIHLGHQAAKFNLRMALELQKPPEKIRNAHWLVGAHLLAANQPAAALEEFDKSLPPEPTDPDRPLFEGYALLARCLLKQTEAESQWTTLLQKRDQQKSESATATRTQLLTARRVFGQ